MPRMHRWKWLAYLTVTCCLVGNQARADSVREIKSAATLKGICQKMTIKDANITNGCTGLLLQNDFTDGRISFVFASQVGETTDTTTAAVSFSGDGKNQTHKDDDTAIQPLDAVIISSGVPLTTTTLSATGECEFTNPYKGKATVNCLAATPKGIFVGAFLTDGSEPNYIPLSTDKTISKKSYKAKITCTTHAGVKTAPHLCFVSGSRYGRDTSLKTTINNRSQIYHAADIMRIAEASKLEITLPEHFTLEAQNSAEYVTLGIVIEEENGTVIFEDQADRYDMIYAKN